MTSPYRDIPVTGDLEHQMHHYTDKEEYDRLLPAAIEIRDPLPTSFPKNTDTKYLDGLRGLFAVFVYVHHFIAAFTIDTELGFGWEGNYYITTLPFIRLPWSSGGPVGVAVFFILSGYVLSVGTLRKLKSTKTRDARRGIVSALIRRPLRLYIPCMLVSLTVALLLQVPGFLLDENFSVPQPTLGAQLYDWWWSTIDYLSLMRDHVPGGYFYNGPVWTLPIELKGSILVYSVLTVLSLGVSGVDYRVPHMMALFIFGCAAIMLQMRWKWTMVLSLFGLVLAILDVWPLESRFSEKSMSQTTLLDRTPLLPQVSRLLQKLLKATSIGAQKPLRRGTLLVARVIPRPWLERLASSSQDEKMMVPDRRESNTLAIVVFFIGWYIISIPSIPDHREVALGTPGYRWLTRMTPPNYLDFEYFRYWQAWGSFMIIWSIMRLPWLQRLFMLKPLQFCGRISFMLYLTHMPYFRTLPGRLVGLFGGHVNEALKGTFWDGTLAFPDAGPKGLSSRFLLCLTITLPINMIIAKYAIRVIDQPGVKLGRWITETIGLDQRKPKKQEVIVLPK
ncbi:membrane protein acetyltransferase-like protein [Teratosphaeria destructans]|uniref:Membrane protein acetyltransferase-like protein n=1 Tax=Teratosphaeria destructans TaxID=418781 RepID=A0A9W7W6W3_9PEZI|nr:membrane protein acetyltransferase-like protein [Teratosphaeria destructans]